jgi:serine/threonine-protein kinase
MQAQWEKAASWDEENQTKNVYPWGDSIDCSFANYFDEEKSCVNATTAVGSYPTGASPYGALDMAGNVWEWVADRYGETYYQNSPSSNPLGPDTGQFRVLRGGSWYFDVNIVRSAYRYKYLPTEWFNNFGFRCARSP